MILRFRLRSVLLLLSLSVLVVPVAGVYLLRLYESALVRQTQSELNVQAVVLGSAFRSAYLDNAPNMNTMGAPVTLHHPETDFQSLDLETSPVYSPVEPYRSQERPDPISELTGKNLASVVTDTYTSQFTNIRITDHRGIIVASSNPDLRLSIRHVEDIQNALTGFPQSRLRTRPVDPTIAAISPASAIRVTLARPIIHTDRVLGVVFLQKAPATILQALSGKRDLLLQATGTMIAVAILIAIFAARTLASPIKQLANDVNAVARGEAKTIGRERPYRTIEVDQLATRIREMATTLQTRAGYLNNFARHVSHEFKTPITAITGAIEVLRDHSKSMTRNETNKFFNNIEEDLKRLGLLTEGLLELAQADMSMISRDTTSLSELELPDAQTSGETSASIQINSGSLSAILNHLTSNAKQHGANNISITAKKGRDSILLTISDDGDGISPANAQRVFDPFFTTRRDSGGTGLGLPIARALAENSGGTLQLLESKRGAVFEICIPLAAIVL